MTTAAITTTQSLRLTTLSIAHLLGSADQETSDNTEKDFNLVVYKEDRVITADFTHLRNNNNPFSENTILEFLKKVYPFEKLQRADFYVKEREVEKEEEVNVSELFFSVPTAIVASTPPGKHVHIFCMDRMYRSKDPVRLYYFGRMQKDRIVSQCFEKKAQKGRGGFAATCDVYVIPLELLTRVKGTKEVMPFSVDSNRSDASQFSNFPMEMDEDNKEPSSQQQQQQQREKHTWAIIDEDTMGIDPPVPFQISNTVDDSTYLYTFPQTVPDDSDRVFLETHNFQKLVESRLQVLLGLATVETYTRQFSENKEERQKADMITTHFLQSICCRSQIFKEWYCSAEEVFMDVISKTATSEAQKETVKNRMRKNMVQLAKMIGPWDYNLMFQLLETFEIRLLQTLKTKASLHLFVESEK